MNGRHSWQCMPALGYFWFLTLAWHFFVSYPPFLIMLKQNPTVVQGKGFSQLSTLLLWFALVHSLSNKYLSRIMNHILARGGTIFLVLHPRLPDNGSQGGRFAGLRWHPPLSPILTVVAGPPMPRTTIVVAPTSGVEQRRHQPYPLLHVAVGGGVIWSRRHERPCGRQRGWAKVMVAEHGAGAGWIRRSSGRRGGRGVWHRKVPCERFCLFACVEQVFTMP